MAVTGCRVPSVINELDGLSRGGGGDGGMAADVAAAATAAVRFLERQFEARHSHLRALTCRGSELETIAFRSEERQGDVSARYARLPPAAQGLPSRFRLLPGATPRFPGLPSLPRAGWKVYHDFRLPA